MKRPLREKDIEQHFCEEIKRRGGIAYKFTSPQRRSVPDRLVVMPNSYSAFVEVKNGDAPLTKGQELEHTRLRSLGHDVYVIRTKEESKIVAAQIHDNAWWAHIR